MHARWTPLLGACLTAAPIAAQQRTPAQCDSIIAAARVDTVEIGLFLSAQRVDGGQISANQINDMVANVGAAFIAPKPLVLSVFSGPARLRLLRRKTDTIPELRAPTVTGVYRLITMRDDGLAHIGTIRESTLRGFDSAAVEAIRAATSLQPMFWPPPGGGDTLVVDIRFATDSTAGARRLMSGRFPRMRVADALPNPNNPPPWRPLAVPADSVPSEVVLRFIVGHEGVPVPGTAEVIRGGGEVAFAESALKALPLQRFTPATIRGCAVDQVVEYPFTFVPPSPREH